MRVNVLRSEFGGKRGRPVIGHRQPVDDVLGLILRTSGVEYSVCLRSHPGCVFTRSGSERPGNAVVRCSNASEPIRCDAAVRPRIEERVGRRSR